MLNIPLLQFVLFKALKSNKDLILRDVRVEPTIVPSASFFSDLNVDTENYVKFIQSSFKVSFLHRSEAYYFFFRNRRDYSIGSYTDPSSVEVIYGGDKSPVLKKHYDKIAFIDEQSMKDYIVDFCKKFVDEFVERLKERGVIS